MRLLTHLILPAVLFTLLSAGCGSSPSSGSGSTTPPGGAPTKPPGPPAPPPHPPN